jgi:hypothetical protein
MPSMLLFHAWDWPGDHLKPGKNNSHLFFSLAFIAFHLAMAAEGNAKRRRTKLRSDFST